MSVRDTDVIDYVYLEDTTQTPVLVVSDPMSWKPPETEEHLAMLRSKLNSQIAFVETGQIGSVYPPYHGERVRVEVIARHSLSHAAEAFYGVAKRVMADCNIDLEFRLCDA